ncbi:unnamed protein product [Trifolium pratense]|uniref:Uncharacterized protein n=1 Tax=Trifolium pratense TaxID=57577 RepID=A0ACB0JH79_TRIPR|nr:unnamed protein product [Trifolium pratense]
MSKRLRLSIFSRKDRDIISSLPDSILYHILSFLPTKDAAATSVLAKRWKPLWFSQLNLHFDDKYFPDAFAFRQFLYSIITIRDNTLPIHSFHLTCCHHGFYYRKDFYNAVYAAITRRVQNLSIDLCYHDRYGIMRLPTLVLTTKTLSVLKLKRVKLIMKKKDHDVVVDLPYLKVLHLESVCFTYYQDIIKLLSGCPILEDFEAKDLIVKSSRLNPLLPSGRDALSISNLVRANISSVGIELDWLRNAHHLCIQVWRNYGLNGMFHNLTYMELTFKLPYPTGFTKWTWLTKLLQKSPKLQTLIIDEINVDTVPYYNCGEWREPTTVPECLSSHLTTCTIRNYSRFNCGFQFAKYIMQNSRVLSTMTIQSSKSIDTDTKFQMLKELSLCPMISTTCKPLLI